MDKYKVMLYPKAIEDIDSIYQYIAMEKLAPETAKEQTDRIWDKIATLETLPQSHQYRLVGRYAGESYSQLLIDNYICIYKIDETSKTVYIVTIQ